MRRFTLIILASVAAIAARRAQEQPLPLTTRAEQEQFLLHASLAGDTPTPTEARRPWRVTLDDGKRKHAATVEAADGAIPPLATIASTSRRTSWTNSSPEFCGAIGRTMDRRQVGFTELVGRRCRHERARSSTKGHRTA